MPGSPEASHRNTPTPSAPGLAHRSGAIFRGLAALMTVGLLLLAAVAPTPATVLASGAGILAYALGSFGAER